MFIDFLSGLSYISSVKTCLPGLLKSKRMFRFVGSEGRFHNNYIC